MKIISGNSNRPLSQSVGEILDTPLTEAAIRRFADHEIFVEIQENVRGQDVFVIQSTSFPANDHLMELLIVLDALRRGSARRITAVIPYFGYARQDRKTTPRAPITAKLVANLLSISGANRILTFDLHAPQIQGFFDIPVDNLFASPLFRQDILENFENPLIVSPDIGGVLRARAVANKINGDLAVIDKRRERPGVSEVVNIIGDVKGRECLLIDDIVDSGGTLCHGALALLEKGAKSVDAYAIHGVLSLNAVDRIEKSAIRSLIVTDSILPTPTVLKSNRIRVLSIAPLLAEAIRRIACEESVSCLFE